MEPGYIVYQEEEDKAFRQRWHFSNSILMTGCVRHGVALKRVAVFKVPEYHPFIKIRLPRSDAKIIYRAIPKNGQISVFL